MHCPYCNSDQTEVVETRVSDERNNIRRRRLCCSCRKRFTTYERVENVMLIVRKKGSKAEQFNREKLKGGILKSVEKTTVTPEHVEDIVDAVERDLRGRESVEIESSKIGQAVAQRLKKLDKVAYIRFASVFKHFVDVEDFEKEVKKLIKK